MCTTTMALAVTQHACATQAIGSGLVNVLLPCLTQGSLSLACATLEALMQITIAVQGKQAMVRVTQCHIWIFCLLANLIFISWKVQTLALLPTWKAYKAQSTEQMEASVMLGDIPGGHLAHHTSLWHH